MLNYRSIEIYVLEYIGNYKVATYLQLDYYDIALDKTPFSAKKYIFFSYFWTKTYVVGTH